jgi:hypothetical protein
MWYINIASWLVKYKQITIYVIEHWTMELIRILDAFIMFKCLYKYIFLYKECCNLCSRLWIVCVNCTFWFNIIKLFLPVMFYLYVFYVQTLLLRSPVFICRYVCVCMYACMYGTSIINLSKMESNLVVFNGAKAAQGKLCKQFFCYYSFLVQIHFNIIFLSAPLYSKCLHYKMFPHQNLYDIVVRV